jgi:hypothetical protein
LRAWRSRTSFSASASCSLEREGKNEGGGEMVGTGERDLKTKGTKRGRKDEEREGGREGGREREREGGREGGREERRKGGRAGR